MRRNYLRTLSHLFVVSKWVQSKNKKWQENHLSQINQQFCLILGVEKLTGPPRGFGDLGRRANYYRGAGEQAHTFGDLGSTAKK